MYENPCMKNELKKAASHCKYSSVIGSLRLASNMWNGVDGVPPSVVSSNLRLEDAVLCSLGQWSSILGEKQFSSCRGLQNSLSPQEGAMTSLLSIPVNSRPEEERPFFPSCVPHFGYARYFKQYTFPYPNYLQLLYHL